MTAGFVGHKRAQVHSLWLILTGRGFLLSGRQAEAQVGHKDFENENDKSNSVLPLSMGQMALSFTRFWDHSILYSTSKM